MSFLSAVYLKFVVYPSFIALFMHYKSQIGSNAYEVTSDADFNSFAYGLPFDLYEFDEYSQYAGIA